MEAEVVALGVLIAAVVCEDSIRFAIVVFAVIFLPLYLS